jgi:GntR family transcriptional regulator
MYLQIADDLRQRIEQGAALPPEGDAPADVAPDGQLPTALRPGCRLPTELGLSDAYSASRNTIRDAIKRLTSLGLVETRQGQGTFVTRKIDPFVTVLSTDPLAPKGAEGATYLSDVNSSHRNARVGGLKVEVQAPPVEVSRRLRISPTTQVVSRHEQRYVDDIPWSLQTSFYPVDFATDGATRLLMAKDIAEGTVRYIAEVLGRRQVGYRDWITARSPDVNEQSFFELAHDATVFVLFRTAFDQTGTPLRVTVTVYPTDRNQFIFNVGEVPDPSYEGSTRSASQPETQAQADSTPR